MNIPFDQKQKRHLQDLCNTMKIV